MNIRIILAALVSVVMLSAFGLSPACAKSHSGAITMTVDLSAHESAGEAEVWIPYPVSDDDQAITDVKISGDFTASAVYADAAYSTPMLYARWNKDARSRKLSFVYKAARKEVIRRDFPAKEAAWDPADYARYLAATALGPVDGR